MEVVYIFPGNLDSSLADLNDCFLKVAFFHTFIQYLVLCTFAFIDMIQSLVNLQDSEAHT